MRRLFGGHEALRTPALFALVNVVDKARFLYFSARKTHLLTTLDTIRCIVQRLRLISAKFIHACVRQAYQSGFLCTKCKANTLIRFTWAVSNLPIRDIKEVNA